MKMAGKDDKKAAKTAVPVAGEALTQPVGMTLPPGKRRSRAAVAPVGRGQPVGREPRRSGGVGR